MWVFGIGAAAGGPAAEKDQGWLVVARSLAAQATGNDTDETDCEEGDGVRFGHIRIRPDEIGRVGSGNGFPVGDIGQDPGNILAGRGGVEGTDVLAKAGSRAAQVGIDFDIKENGRVGTIRRIGENKRRNLTVDYRRAGSIGSAAIHCSAIGRAAGDDPG